MNIFVSAITVLTALIGAITTLLASLHTSHHENYGDKFKALQQERDNLLEDYEKERKRRIELEEKYEKLKKKLENTK